MIDEVVILYFQLSATILMGIDYFVSEKFKENLDTYVKSKVELLQNSADNRIIELSVLLKSEGFKKLKHSLLLLLLWLCITIIIGIVIGVYFISEYASYVFYVGLLLSTLFILLFLRLLVNFVIENFVPFSLPILLRIITTFILFIKKGAIAGIGILLLLISFGLRYYNLKV